MKNKWSDIKVSFGDGNRIPALLENLKNNNLQEREKSYWDLTNLTVLQSDLYEGAYYIIDPLIALLEDSLCKDKFYPLDILYEIFDGSAPSDVKIEIGDKATQLPIACRNRIIANRRVIENVRVSTEKEVKAKDDLLTLLDNPKDMFPSEHSKENAKEILKSLGLPPSAGGL